MARYYSKGACQYFNPPSALTKVIKGYHQAFESL